MEINNKLNIVYKKVDELIPYVNNPRDNKDAIDKVASSIKNFGFKVPLVIDSQNEVITGHTRLLASKKLGIEEVPVIIANDLSEAQVKAFRIADNKVSEYAEWDEDLLKVELEELQDLDFNLLDTGFELDDLEVMLNLGFDYSEDDFGDEFTLPEGDKKPIQQISFTFHDNQVDLITHAMDDIESRYDKDELETFGNENKKGNLLYMVVKEWAEQKK